MLFIGRWSTVLLILVFTAGCTDKNQETYFQELLTLYPATPNQQCIKSWMSNMDHLLVPSRLPARDLTKPFDVQELANQSLVEEAIADKLACEALLTCMSDLENFHDPLFMQRCTTGRMFSRMDELEYVFDR